MVPKLLLKRDKPTGVDDLPTEGPRLTLGDLLALAMSLVGILLLFTCVPEAKAQSQGWEIAILNADKSLEPLVRKRPELRVVYSSQTECVFMITRVRIEKAGVWLRCRPVGDVPSRQMIYPQGAFK